LGFNSLLDGRKMIKGIKTKGNTIVSNTVDLSNYSKGTHHIIVRKQAPAGSRMRTGHEMSFRVKKTPSAV